MEVRTAVTRNGGTMADPGSVSRLFNRKGVVVLSKAQEGKEVGEDDVLEATLDAGAEDVNDLGETWQVISEATDVVAVRSALQQAGLDYESADVEFVASLEIPVADAATAGKVLKLVDAVDDLDDVQNVFTNADIPDEIMEQLDAE
jgi:transcriptional/translational regulatory protein YebC/TACO1